MSSPRFIPLQVAAHPSVSSERGAERNPHFERIGGREVIAKLANRFYDHMRDLPEAAVVRAMHPSNLARPREVLERYLVEWMGGPQLYSAERGHPRLRRRHLPFSIGVAERDAWMRCMRLALEETVADASLRAELEQAFAEVADFLRNRSEPDAPPTHQPPAGGHR